MKILILLSILLISLSMQTDKEAYKIYNKKGKQVEYKKMLKEIQKADIIFIGELHDNPISHWLEYEITNDIFSENRNITLGAEMFEADNQMIMNEYLTGLISTKKFEAEIRLWPNYKTDYKPLVEFAKKNKLKFVATNIPRRYASIVFKNGFKGLEKLSVEAKKYIAPMPIAYEKDLKCYADMLEMGKQMGHTSDNFPKSQAIKDATMAYFILQNYKKGTKFIHYNGAYHSDNYESIVWHIKKANPNIKIATITTISSENIDKISDEDKAKADFIIVVPENMTSTY